MTRSPVLTAASVVVLSLLPAPSSRLPVVVEYSLPRPKAFPHDPAVGADGIVWYTDQVNSYIGRLDPATGKVTDYPTPTPMSGPHGIVVAPDGGVWYTGNFTARLGRLDPVSGSIKEKSGSLCRAGISTACSILRRERPNCIPCRRAAPGPTGSSPPPTG